MSLAEESGNAACYIGVFQSGNQCIRFRSFFGIEFELQYRKNENNLSRTSKNSKYMRVWACRNHTLLRNYSALFLESGPIDSYRIPA